jgi:hypothetical protein
VRLPNTSLEFEITRRGVEVNAEGMRYVMYQERNIERDSIVFSVTVDGRWVCRVSQCGYDGTSTFEVLDKCGDPIVRNDDYWEKEYAAAFQTPLLTSPANEKRKVLLLCP